MKFRFFHLLLAVGLGVTGCARAAANRYPFPQAWPLELPQPTLSAAARMKGGPRVQVEPFQIGSESTKGVAAAEQAAGAATADVLAQLLVQRLQAEGIEAVRSDASGVAADYVLQVSVPRMEYTIRPGYPRKVDYQTAMSLTLVHEKSGQVAWERDLEEKFEETVLLNTMSRLPRPADPYSQQLLEKCVTPLMTRIASGLTPLLSEWESQLSSRLEASPAQEPPPAGGKSD